MNRERVKRGKTDRALLQLFGQLAPGQQDKLIAFAEFLATRASSARRGAGRGPAIARRPTRETVTMAIRRLVRSYPVLDRRKLMTEASRLMVQHAIGGREAAGVIDELEAVFARHHEQHKSKVDSRKAKA